MDLQTCLFWIVGSLTGLSAIMVVVTQNIVRCAAWLLFTLAGTSAIFFLLGADFVGATQLIVYVGGILVLVVFGVMLTAQGPFISMRTSPAEWGVAVIVGLSLFAVLAFSIVVSKWQTVAIENQAMRNPATSPSTVALGQAFLGSTAPNPSATFPVTGLPPGAPGQTRPGIAYLLPFEIASVHLLVVLIGAAYLARAKRRRGSAA